MCGEIQDLALTAIAKAKLRSLLAHLSLALKSSKSANHHIVGIDRPDNVTPGNVSHAIEIAPLHPIDVERQRVAKTRSTSGPPRLPASGPGGRDGLSSARK